MQQRMIKAWISAEWVHQIEALRNAMHGMMASTETQPNKTLQVDVQIFK